jgi:hypothetical protein
MPDETSKQLNDMSSGLDNLKDSLKEINKAIPEFTDGMESGLKAVAKVLPDVVTSMMQLNAQNKQLAADGGKPVSILSQLASGMFSWNTAISIGTTLLITYGGELLNWVSDLIKGQTSISAFTKALKDSQIVSEAIIQTQLAGQKAAQGEVTSLTTLYKATQSLNLKKSQQLEAANMLKKQWPETFKNLSAEAIVAGKAAGAYNNLKKELIATAEAEAYKQKITANASRTIDNGDKIEKERAKNLEILKDQKAIEDQISTLNIDIELVRNQSRFTSQASKDRSAIAGLQNQLDKVLQKRVKSDKILYDLNSDNVLLDKQNDGLAKKIEDNIKSFNPAILDHNKQADTNSPPKIVTSPPVNTSPPPQKPYAPDPQVDEEKARQESADRMALLLLDGYAKEVEETNQHFDQLRELHKGNNATIEQLEKERGATLDAINKKFQTEELDKLTQYETELNKTSKDARQQAIDQLNDDYKKQADDVSKITSDSLDKIGGYTNALRELEAKTQTNEVKEQIAVLEKKRSEVESILTKAEKVSQQLSDKHQKNLSTLNKSFKQEDDTKEQSGLKDDIQSDQDTGNQQKEFADRQKLIDSEKKQALDAVTGQKEAEQKIRDKYAVQQKKLDKDRLTAEVATQKQYVQALDSVSNAMKAIFGKNTIAAKAAFKAHQAAAAAQVIIDTRQSIMGIWSADSGIPFIGVPKAIAETAIVAAAGASNLATILKQKPGFAKGGQFVSDGRGALLPGYSRTDNTNAYLRSGEAVVVSEAMRNPWARNLVSAINVAHGGRDFSITNPGRGYAIGGIFTDGGNAIGGIFTDGGNANRYYSQPINDAKDLANTMAYQMINNFPPIYVDVKDVNNQQNILAQTVNRVNL